jgi:hypothetical protein
LQVKEKKYQNLKNEHFKAIKAQCIIVQIDKFGTRYSNASFTSVTGFWQVLLEQM